MRYRITAQWELPLEDGFEHRVEDNHLVFWKTGATVVTTVFSYSGFAQQQGLLANLRGKADAAGLESFEETDGALYRFGYLQPEKIAADHVRLALHSFTLAEHSCLQASYYLDRASDLNKALQSWKEVVHTGEESEA